MKQFWKQLMVLIGTPCCLLLFVTDSGFGNSLLVPQSRSNTQSSKPAAVSDSPSTDGDIEIERVDDQKIKELITSLRSRRFEEREGAVAELVEVGLPAVPRLCELVYTKDPELRWRANQALVRIGVQHEENEVAKITRILHLLGTQGRPEMLTAAFQARQTWKLNQFKRTQKKISDVGGRVVSLNDANQIGRPLFVDGRAVLLDAGGRVAGNPYVVPINQKKLQVHSRESGPSRKQALTPQQVLEEIRQILADNQTADEEALRKLPTEIAWREENPALRGGIGSKHPVFHTASSSPVLPSVFLVEINQKWKGSEKDFKLLLDLPSIQKIQLSDIAISDALLDILFKLRVGSISIHRCKFNSTKLRAISARRPDLYLDVRGKALLGVRGPIAAAAAVFGEHSPKQRKQKELCEISEVIMHSAAQRAGIQVGDIISSVDGNKIETFQDLIYEIAGRDIGESVEIKLTRKGQSKSLTLKLGDSEDPSVDVDD